MSMLAPNPNNGYHSAGSSPGAEFRAAAPGLLRTMLTVRESDRREAILLRQGQGCFHVSCAGHEALSVLTCHLAPEDYLFPYYRDKAVVHARGVGLAEIARCFFARQTASSAGRNMPSHLSSRALNVFSVTTPTGAQCLPAVGAAWGLKRRREPGVVLCFIGDAATRQGEFYEALCLAIQERLPVVFVVEDNHYGISTPTQRFSPRTLGMLNAEIVLEINGRDAEALFREGKRVISGVRQGGGPCVLWCDLDRLDSHTSSDDQRVYRPADELDRMAGRDPILLLSDLLIRAGVMTEGQWGEMRLQVAEGVRAEYQRAASEPAPSGAAEAESHLYGLTPASYPPLSLSPSTGIEGPSTMLEAVRSTLRAALQENSLALLYGEDIEDPKGGVFGLTRGLSTDFPGRVTNSPLAEATIVGTAAGLGAVGCLPIFELQFIDFMAPAFNQLVSQVTNLRWRTRGDWSCPMVLYAPYGAYLPGGGMWHSQSGEGWFAHMPGLRVAVPSTPADAAGLFWAALHDPDPSLILLPKRLLRVRSAAQPVAATPFGRAAVRREGRDVSLIAWGNCVGLCREAADRLAGEGVSAEVVDLRTLVPCDWETVAASLAKTGRLVVVQEDTRTCGFGQAVVAEMVTRTERFYTLSAPPQLVTRADVPVPFSPALELALLPSVQSIVAAAKAALE